MRRGAGEERCAARGTVGWKGRGREGVMSRVEGERRGDGGRTIKIRLPVTVLIMSLVMNTSSKT